MNFYVYIYLDPRKPGRYIYGSYEFEYEPFYVGKGKNGRWKNVNERSKYFKRVINKIKEYGLEPLVIKIKENLNEENSFILESKLINLIGRKDLNDGTLLNFTDGGEGTNGWICSDETRKKQSERMKGNKNYFYGKHFNGKNAPFYGKHRSEESKRKQSERMKGENHPFYGKHHSEETKKKQSEKKKGEFSPRSILKEKDVIEIWKDLKEGILTQKQIGEKFVVSNVAISNIKTGRTWLYIKNKMVGVKNDRF